MAQRQVDVINFDRVDVAGPVAVLMTPGPEGAVVTIDDNLLDRVMVEVRNRVLIIDFDADQATPTVPVSVEVSFAEIQAVELSGTGELHVRRWAAEEASVVLSGAGDVTVEVTATNLDVLYPGAGSMTIVGEAITQTIVKAGLGPYHAGQLRSSVVDITSTGIGEVELWVTDQLTYNVTGQGALRFWGSPTADGRISSQGGLVGLGDK